MEGKPSYLACLTFQEGVTQEILGELNLSPDGLQDETNTVVSSDEQKTIYYVPKSLVLISRNRYYNILKVSVCMFYFAQTRRNKAYITVYLFFMEKIVYHLDILFVYYFTLISLSVYVFVLSRTA